MRRVWAVVVVASLVLSWGTTSALATRPHHERYETRWVNAFWHFRKNVDHDTYLRITWYAGAYDSRDQGFFSDLYRSVERCQRQAGRDSCRYQRDSSWYGDTRRLGQNAFTVDNRLSTGHLDATYRLFRTLHHDRVLVGRFHVVADISGTGTMTRGRQDYTSHQGCTTVRYSGKFKYRQATARGTLARDGGAARDLGSTSDANFGENQNVEIEHSC
jgi:hypothetical protein